MIHMDLRMNQLWITLEIILFTINWKFSVQSSAAKSSTLWSYITINQH